MKALVIVLLGMVSAHCYAQNEILTWNDHFSYRPVEHVDILGNKMIAATDLGAFIYDQEDASFTRLSKTNKLSDAGISAVKAIPEREMILFGYENGNIDIWLDGRVINVSDVLSSNVLADRTVNSFYILEEFAYVCTEFGIIQLDLEKFEIKDTFIIGNQGTYLGVNDLEIQNGEIIAATNSGIYKATFPNIFLADPQTWSLDLNSPILNGDFEGLEEFNGFLFTHIAESDGDVIYRKDIVTDSAWEAWQNEENLRVKSLVSSEDYLVVTNRSRINQYNSSLESIKEIFFVNSQFPDFHSAVASPNGDGIWIADKNGGLFHASNSLGIQLKIPNGPDFSDARRINSFFENVWVATGGVDLGYDGNFKRAGINSFINNKWSSITLL